MKKFMALLSLVTISLSSSCATPNMELTARGVISGKLMVWWVGEDNFIYYPYFNDPLKFQLPPPLAKAIGANVIRPGAMYTDGGSIPRPLRGVVGLSPWGYGPAYIVHDWLFAARHCILTGQENKLDPRDRAEVEIVKRINFEQSANVLASVVTTLIADKTVPPHEIAPRAIYTAVDSFVARRLWNATDPKSCETVPESELQKIRKAIESHPNLKALEAAPFVGDQPRLIFQQDF